MWKGRSVEAELSKALMYKVLERQLVKGAKPNKAGKVSIKYTS